MHDGSRVRRLLHGRAAARFFPILLLIGVLTTLVGPARAQAGPSGTIRGEVRSEGTPVINAVVQIAELRVTEVTDEQGRFSFQNVPVGTYTLVLTLGENTASRDAVAVSAGEVTRVEIAVDDWDLGVVEEVTVTAAARAAKIVDAPAAVTSVPEEQIEQQASTGQVPKILEFTPGAEVTQSGLYDFNFNTRGFNSSLNRRVSTYIDGRDVGVVLLGAQEWAAISGGLDDVATLDFIRGPSAALYGANASSGVVNIVTKAPRESQGTLLRMTGGELDTVGLDYRWAQKLGKGWYSKVIFGGRDSGDFTISRDPDVIPQPEYSEFCMLVGETDCLVREKTLFIEQDNKIRYGSIRIDKYLDDDRFVTVEGGLSDIEGPVFQTGIGRVQGLEAKRPFVRASYATPRWNVLAHWAGREGDQVNLTKELRVNFELITDTERYGMEAQGNWNFFGDKLRLVAGVAHTEERVDTENPATGRQTVVYEPIETDRQAIFSQLDWKISERFKLVFAGRVDWNTLHDTQFSPKAALVYRINPMNSVRLTFNEAFQVANYSEFFLNTRIAAFPIGGFVRTICESPVLAQPVDCGIDEDFIPILAVGNDDLELEKTSAWEIGYTGLLWKKLFITVDYYAANNENFITDLIPQVGTILGNTEGCLDRQGMPEDDPTECPINNDYLPWVSTDEAENTILIGTLSVAQALRNAVDNSVGGNTLGFRLAQNLNGDTVVVGRTYSNVGEVETQGVDFGLQYFITQRWKVQMNYSWFDFEILDEAPQIREILLPNTPENKGSLSVSYGNKKFQASVGARWVEEFRWSAGVFQGQVPEYTTVDMSANYNFNATVSAGINVANALDEVHRQTFGGDLLTRRALANVTFRWR